MLLRHSGFYLLSWIVPSASSFAALLIFTRFLAPEDYGLYATVTISVALVYTLSLNWICASALRLYGATSDRAGFLSALLWSYLSVMALLTLIGFAASGYVPGLEDRGLVAIGLALIAVNGWLEINLHLLRAELQSGHYALANVLRSGLGAVAGVALVYFGCGALGAVCGVLLGALVPALWLTWRNWRVRGIGWPQRAMITTLFHYGLPLTVSYALEAVYWYSDRLLLATMMGAAAVGLYAVGFDMADKTIKGIMVALGSGAGLPLAISLLENDGPAAARRQLKINLAFLLTGGLPAAVGLMAIAPTLATFVGAEYREGARELIPVITAATFLSALRGNYFDHAFYLGRRTTLFVIVMFGGAFANAGLCLVLIPHIGVMGAAYATLSAYALTLVLGIITGRHAFALPIPWSDIGKIGLATAIMALAVIAVPEWPPSTRIVAQIVIGGLVYAPLVVMLDIGGWRPAIVGRLRRMLRVPAPQPVSEHSRGAEDL
jgi:O-antigen/teichoic acid export membrane protein